MLLVKHQQSKAIILEKLAGLADLADRVGMAVLANDIRHQRISKLKNEQFHLVVLGEFNHGKSTFVNALLENELLPTGITPTTATLNHIVYSPSPTAKVLTTSGDEIALSPSAIAEWITTTGKHADVQYLEIGVPSALLKGNITLVDTPGVNDLNEQRSDITYGYVPRADAIIFLLDATQALKESEREFLSSHVLEGCKNRLIFILGKMDLLDAAERKAAIAYVHSGLQKFVENPVIFPLSAKTWLEGKQQDSGFPELLTYLDQFLDTDRAQIILDNAIVDASRTAALVHHNLGIKRRALGLELSDLKGRVHDVKAQLGSSKRKIDELNLRIKTETDAIKSQVELTLNDFTQRFAKIIIQEIDRVDPDDLQQYLGPFVQDKFREWSETQGQQVSQLLEKLAEEIITITNENIAETFNSLSSRLGPAHTNITIDTDSFAYDLGIYAVGAVGTTVFLFVNTLAGGLLTLVAPVLAIIVKSKVSGDIKEQAKTRAPEVILHAGQTMMPYFAESIDNFGVRLRNFVTTAGTDLYKGITEVLEKTLVQRQDGADVIASLVEAANVDHNELSKLRGELDDIRETIWLGRFSSSDSSEEETSRQTPPPIPDDSAPLETTDISPADHKEVTKLPDEDIEETNSTDPLDKSRKDLN